MGGYSSSSGGSPGSGGTKKQARSFSKKNKPTPIRDFIAGGGITGAIIRGVSSAIKHQKTKNRKSKSGDVYAGEAYGYNEAEEKKDYKPNIDTQNNRDGPNKYVTKDLKGIELAKASTTSATILGPEEIQKNAANTIKGPTTTEMTADQILLANKRKGRKITNITGPVGLEKKEKLSKKILLA